MKFIAVERLHPVTSTPQGTMWININTISAWFWGSDQMSIVLTNGLVYYSSIGEEELVKKLESWL